MQEVKAEKQHCKYCFDVLINKLQKKPIPEWPNILDNHNLPIFVTWKKEGDLRGCIGTFSPGSLNNILAEYAITAAMKDSRFDPIDESEVSKLSVGVSFLVNFQHGKKAYDWTVGKHGIIIKAVIGKIPYSATFLPQVASDQGWTQETTLKHLIRKAGYRGEIQEFIDKIDLTTYESSKESMTYEEYTKFINK